MSNIYGREDEVQVIGGGYGGGYGLGGGGLGGVGALIALVVVVAVLWFLGREGKDNYNGGCGMPYPYPAYPYPPYGGGGCGNPCFDCKPQMAIDMSNCEVDKDLWKVDADVWKSACETQKVVTDGDTAILNKLCDQELKAVERALAAALADKTALESKFYTEKKFGDIEALLCKYDNQNDKQYYMLQKQLADIKCDMPVKQPIFWDGVVCNTHHIDCQHDDFPRRRGFNRCDCDKDCGCCG